MKLQVVFSTANFVYKFKKSENFEKRRYFFFFFFFFFFFIGLSRCSNDLPIHPGFWPTNNITIHIVHVLA